MTPPYRRIQLSSEGSNSRDSSPGATWPRGPDAAMLEDLDKIIQTDDVDQTGFQSPLSGDSDILSRSEGPGSGGKFRNGGVFQSFPKPIFPSLFVNSR